MAFQLKISKPDNNVLTTTDPKNLIFDASLNHLKTALYGSFQRTVDSGYDKTTVSVEHGLGGKPLAVAYFRDTSTGDWQIAFTQIAAVLPCRSNFNCEISVDSTYVKFMVSNYSGSTKTFEVKYEIFYEGV